MSWKCNGCGADASDDKPLKSFGAIPSDDNKMPQGWAMYSLGNWHPATGLPNEGHLCALCVDKVSEQPKKIGVLTMALEYIKDAPLDRDEMIEKATEALRKFHE